MRNFGNILDKTLYGCDEMKYKLFFGLILIFIFLKPMPVHGSDTTPVPIDGVLDLSSMEDLKVIDLNGAWRLYPQRFISPNEINKEKDYVLIDVPDTWEYTTHKGSYLKPQTYATYYLRINLPKNTDVFSLYIPDISSAYKLFINKEFITEMGNTSTVPENEIGKWKPTVVTYSPKENTAELVLQVSNFHHNDGGIWESILIGPVEKIYFRRIVGLMRGILLSGILLAFTFYFVNFYFVVKPRNHSTLYLALGCFLAFIREFITKDVPLQFLYAAFPFKAQVALEYITLCGSAIVITEYVLYNFNSNRYLKYFKRFLDAVLIIMILIIILAPMTYYTTLVIPIQITVIANLLVITMVTILSIISKNKEAKILLVGSLLLLFFSSLEMAFLNRFFRKSILFDMGIVVFILFLLLLIHLHNRLTNKVFSEASKSKDREVAFLRAQIVPHFINNALSNAIYLIHDNPNKAKKFLIELSNLMVNKYNFTSDNSLEEIPFGKELEIIRSYVYIQNIRFNNKISFIEDIDDRALDVLIPPLLIQPLIENSIIHGLSNNNKSNSELHLSASLENNFLVIIVEDNGTGISAQNLIKLESNEYKSDKSIGIKNIKERVQNIKGSSFKISSKLGVNTIITIKINLKG